MKKIIKKIVHRKFYLYLKKVYKHHKISFSQEGEDILLDHLFLGKNNGFYIDIGAYHPQRFSNTYNFYLKGWRGLNVDATPGSMKKFNEIRIHDINIETAIGSKKEVIDFYITNEGAMNTANEEIKSTLDFHKEYNVEREIKVKSTTLKEIFRLYLPKNTKIDFMSIDIEGNDLKALQSNDWEMFRPKYLCVEDSQRDLQSSLNSEISLFMKKNDYSFICRTFKTSIFKDLL